MEVGFFVNSNSRDMISRNAVNTLTCRKDETLERPCEHLNRVTAYGPRVKGVSMRKEPGYLVSDTNHLYSANRGILEIVGYNR